MRVVRYQFSIGYVGGDTVDVQWAEGSLLPLGIAYPWEFRNGTAFNILGGDRVEMRATTISPAEGDPGDLEIAIEPALWFAGRYVYGVQRNVPSRILDASLIGRVDGPAVLSSYVEGPLLAGADVWPVVGIPTGPSFDTRVFGYPGSDTDLMGVGASPDDAWAVLRGQQPEVDSSLSDGSCVGGGTIQPKAVTGTTAVLPSATATFTFFLYTPTATLQKWTASFERTAAKGGVFENQTFGCTAMAGSLAPRMSAAAFVAKARALETTIGASASLLVFSPQEGPFYPLLGNRFTAAFPSHDGPGMGLLYNIQQSSVTGSWMSMAVPQRVLLSLDEHGFPA